MSSICGFRSLTVPSEYLLNILKETNQFKHLHLPNVHRYNSQMNHNYNATLTIPIEKTQPHEDGIRHRSAFKKGIRYVRYAFK